MTEQNRTDFRWNRSRHLAAQLLAEDELSDSEIAEKCGVGRTTLWTWSKHIQFRNRVEEMAKDIGTHTRRYALAKKSRRIQAMTARWLKMQQVIDERASDPNHANAPGGSTGLLCRKLKIIGSGDNAQLVEEFEVDTGLLRELREHERRAAEELGQIVVKQEIDNKTTMQLVEEIVDAPPDTPVPPE